MVVCAYADAWYCCAAGCGWMLPWRWVQHLPRCLAASACTSLSHSPGEVELPARAAEGERDRGRRQRKEGPFVGKQQQCAAVGTGMRACAVLAEDVVSLLIGVKSCLALWKTRFSSAICGVQPRPCSIRIRYGRQEACCVPRPARWRYHLRNGQCRQQMFGRTCLLYNQQAVKLTQ